MKTAFIFPGQGAQTLGMGKDMYENNETYKKVFDLIDEGLEFSLKDVCFDGMNMDKSEYAQPAIYAHSVALLSALNKKADVYAGLSLGEYSALAAVGMIDVVKCAQLVNARGHIMDNALEPGKGGMMSILGLNIEEVTKLLANAKDVWVANHLSEKQIVISGDKKAIGEIKCTFDEAGAKTIELNTSGPFHTKMLENAANEFINLLYKANFSETNAIIYSNYTAKPYESTELAPKLLAKQMCSRVKWHDIIETLIAEGITEFVEIGPSMVLSKMLKRRLKGLDVKVSSIRDLKSFNKYVSE